MTWSKTLAIPMVWSLVGLLVIVPVAIVAADRFLWWGGIAAFLWGPPLVGMVAGVVHRDVKIGLLTAVGVLILGGILFAVMIAMAFSSLPGP